MNPERRILYFTRHPDHFEQWTIVDGGRIDLPNLAKSTPGMPGLILTHWPTRRYVEFDEAVEQ